MMMRLLLMTMLLLLLAAGSVKRLVVYIGKGADWSNAKTIVQRHLLDDLHVRATDACILITL
jgi:hypothetical protein